MLQCVRGMCTEPATVGLGYDVPGTKAWLSDLDAATMAGTGRQRDMLMPLCRAHADRIKVPVGWELADQRAPEPAPVAAPWQANDEPAASVDESPLFRPRTRPEPAADPGTAAEAVPEHEPTASLLERAFRAAPSR